MAESTLTSTTTVTPTEANVSINLAATNTNRQNRPSDQSNNNRRRPNSKRSSYQSENSYYNNSYNNYNNSSYYNNNTNANDSYYDYNQYPSQNKNQNQNQNKQSRSLKSAGSNKQANSKSNKINNNTNSKEQSKSVNGVKEVKPIKRIENETRTEILIEQLTKNKYECMVCYYAIKHDTAIWCCPCCSHIFHLFCIKKWARSTVALIDESSQSWRCPGCQTPIESVPNKYTCFCSKKINPEFNKHITPHSCGECCGKPKNSPLNTNCIHKCTLLCHPGPCPQCEAMVYKQCGCGKLKFQIKCNSAKIPICDNTCNKILDCGIHRCELKCHPSNCCSCDINIEQRCYSHDTLKILKCGTLTDHSQKQYKCEQLCNKLLKCKEHRCEKLCHAGECNECPLLPDNLKSCPCGKTLIHYLLDNKPRVKCTDDIPTCQKMCDKLLKCSDNDSLHFCQSKCHHGDCFKCEKIVKISCRCGSKNEELPCFEAQKYKENPLFCEKRCTKKLSCTRHRCTEICCNNKEHLCTFICNRILNCGKHNCDQLCHKGNCMKCSTSSYHEWVCHCGSTVVFPPIKCGTKLPDCPQPCDRQRECEHPVQHACHSEDTCPPCSFLTAKMCMGNHEVRHSIPCHLKDVSCGMPCGKELPCGKHKCIKTCHKGVCLDAGETCNQPCQNERLHCTHPCLSLCHDGSPCPDTICQAQIVVKCKCGFKSKQLKCLQRFYDSSSIVFENLATEIKEMLSCKTVDINSFRNTDVLKKKHELACDEECLIAERNRNLANALQIDPNNPAPKQQLKTIYSEFLKNFARDEQNFAIYIEKELAIIIKELNNSKQGNKKCLNFPVMKSVERRFIHELCPYYNLETQSQDTEPNRNVRVYATKDKSCLPAQTLTQSLEIKPKQNIIPHVSNLATKHKIAPSSIVLPTYNLDNKLEIKPSSFALLGDLNESDTEEIINKIDLNIKSKGKAIDYFDMTD